MTREDEMELAYAIDQYGLPGVLTTIAKLCEKNAEQLRQDYSCAGETQWDAAAGHVAVAADRTYALEYNHRAFRPRLTPNTIEEEEGN